jgi:hypothetical protein
MISGSTSIIRFEGAVKAEVPSLVCWPNENYAFFQSKTGCPEGDFWTPGFIQHWEGLNSTVPSEALNSTVDG